MTSSIYKTDLVTELTRTALAIHAGKRGRGSFSPANDSCTQQFIISMAKETMYLAHVHERPPARIAETAHKALSALQEAITALFEATGDDEADGLAWASFDEPEAVTEPRRARSVYPGQDKEPDKEGPTPATNAPRVCQLFQPLKSR